MRTDIFPHTLVAQLNQDQTSEPLHFKGKNQDLYLFSVPADEFKPKSARTHHKSLDKYSYNDSETEPNPPS